jgi:orotate phosphoribosyltransferase
MTNASNESSVAQWLISRLLQRGAENFGYTHPRDGRFFPLYPDPRTLMTDRKWLAVATGAITALVHQEVTMRNRTTVCGVATGGIPFATLAAYALGLPFTCLYPRSQKSREPLFYSWPKIGHKLILVDDASGIGLTKLPAVRRLRAESWEVVLVSLQAQRHPLVPEYAELDVRHAAVYDLMQFVTVAVETGQITTKFADCCRLWIADADRWDAEIGRAGYEAAMRGCPIFR